MDDKILSVENDNDSINDELILDAGGENAIVDSNNLEDFREKVRRSGVVYLSSIPEGMTVSYLRQRLQPYGVMRIFLAPEGNHDKKKKYKEGWVEFSEKIYAKLCEYELSGQVIGGKRNLSFREDLWNIKYLHKFKWHHLIEQASYQKKIREQKMKSELAQARREANFIEENFEKSKIINKKRNREKEEAIKSNDFNKDNIKNPNEDLQKKSNENFENFKRNFKQRKPIKDN